MASFALPTSTDLPNYSFQCDLDGTTYDLALRWGDREECWFFTLSTVDGTVLLAGRRLAVGSPLLRGFRDPRLPPGELMAVDTSGNDLEAGQTDLGARVLLMYTEAADLPAGYKR